MDQDNKPKELSKVGSLRLQRGHRCFALDLRTGNVFEVDFPSHSEDGKSLSLDGSHIYVTALNPRNAEKKINKMLSPSGSQIAK